MRYTTLFFALAFSCPLAAAELIIEVQNPLAIDRVAAPVCITVGDIQQYWKGYRYSPIAVFDGDKQLCSQLDDMNGQLSEHELSFLLDIKANETKRLRLVNGGPYNEVCAYDKIRAQMYKKNSGSLEPVRQLGSFTGDAYNILHHHGPAWETEQIAYRVYFDQKQTIDVYGKYNQQLELVQSLWYPTDEQLAQGFGDDILLVKGSIGVGTLKGWDGAKALHIQPVKVRSAEIVSYGPLRTIVDMSVAGWPYMGDTLDVTMRYISYAGHRDVEVRVLSDKPFSPSIQFCTGVQKIQRIDTAFTDNEGLTCTWGTYFPVNDTVKYGVQTVGLAATVPQSIYNGDAEDKVNHLMLIKPTGANRFTYHFWVVSEKEKWNSIKSSRAFFDYSVKEKHLLQNPLSVKLGK
ncbi:MAG: DUF4861 domain-containing protein [Prevotellaceae bacterium]|nr:DUF4861 domain-containing protein [Prevotellaceae bacterium]